MSSSVALDVVIVVVGLAYVLYRQTVARPVVPRSLIILPAILVVLGVSSISHLDKGHLSSTAIAYLAVDLVTSVALGALRGCFVRVYANNGVMWRQGGKVTMALWGLSIAVRIVIAVFASRAGVGDVSDAALDAAFGLSLLAQNGVVALRGFRLGIPFAVRAARN